MLSVEPEVNDPTPFSFIGIAYYETDAGGTVIRNILASDVAAKGQAVRVVRVVARASPTCPDGCIVGGRALLFASVSTCPEGCVAA